jgi:hypothetical protein
MHACGSLIPQSGSSRLRQTKQDCATEYLEQGIERKSKEWGLSQAAPGPAAPDVSLSNVAVGKPFGKPRAVSLPNGEHKRDEPISSNFQITGTLS